MLSTIFNMKLLLNNNKLGWRKKNQLENQTLKLFHMNLHLDWYSRRRVCRVRDKRWKVFNNLQTNHTRAPENNVSSEKRWNLIVIEWWMHNNMCFKLHSVRCVCVRVLQRTYGSLIFQTRIQFNVFLLVSSFYFRLLFFFPIFYLIHFSYKETAWWRVNFMHAKFYADNIKTAVWYTW